MNVRAVRFTGVTRERMDSMLERIRNEGGPPADVPATGITVLFDEAQGTAVVLQHFASMEDLETGARYFAALDPGETPGVRASVDDCEVVLELGS